MRLLTATILAISVSTILGLSEYNENVRKVFKKIEQTPHLKELWDANVLKSQQVKLNDYPFNCEVDDSPHTPANVHELRPQDVSLIIAYGDSITAGNGLGAESLIDVAFQNRGESFSVGGDFTHEDNVVTLANFLRKFNPGLQGQSLGYSFVFEEEAGLNVAVPGNRAVHMPEQSDDLIEKLRYYDAEGLISFENDWKLVTLFIGGNDLCAYCRNTVDRSPERYAGYIQEAVDKLHAEVPKVLVQLVPMFDVTPLRFMSTSVVCDLLQENFCSCARNETTRPALRPVQLAYYEKLKELAEGGRYDTRDDFTVVVQPYMVDMEPPLGDDGEYDTTYFSPDCFHPGRKLHQAMAAGLWNCMLIPTPFKPRTMSYDDREIRCPTQNNPYIFTNRNSQVVSEVSQQKQVTKETKDKPKLNDLLKKTNLANGKA